jgi:hypothetical protein
MSLVIIYNRLSIRRPVFGFVSFYYADHLLEFASSELTNGAASGSLKEIRILQLYSLYLSGTLTGSLGVVLQALFGLANQFFNIFLRHTTCKGSAKN